MTMHIFGDSHAHYNFARCGNATVHWMGPWTMHRVGRDGAVFVIHMAQPGPEDRIVLTFGEIDVRCHLIRIARQEQRNIEAMIETLVDRYLAAIQTAMDIFQRTPRIGILGTVPQMDAIIPNPETPSFGSLQDRTVVRRWLNAALRRRCADHGFQYIDVPRCYEAKDGSLRLGMSDGHAHIAKDHARQVCEAVSRAMDWDLDFRLTGLRERASLAWKRSNAIRRRDAASLWILGR